jgi:hypothetical protein
LASKHRKRNARLTFGSNSDKTTAIHHISLSVKNAEEEAIANVF